MHEGPEIEELDRRPARAATEAGPRPPRLAEDARIGGSPKTIIRSAALVALLVGLAVAKPWGATQSRPTAAATSASASGLGPAEVAALAGPASAPPSATPPPTPPPGAVDCGSPDGWRLVTVGWLAGQPAEAHAVVDPIAAASGPADPRIPSLPAGQAPLVGVGACRPGASPAATGGLGGLPPVQVAGAWRLDGADPVPLAVAPRRPAASATFTRLYGPVATAGDWTPGRYVVELTASDLPGPAWIGFDLTAPPASSPATP